MFAVVACSYVFWLGDLNFRMDQLSAEEVKSRIAVGNIESLWMYDQVMYVMMYIMMRWLRYDVRYDEVITL